MLKLENDENVPADCLVLATSEDEGICYVQTTNLDGETNLKQKIAVRDTLDLIDDAALTGPGCRVRHPCHSPITLTLAHPNHDTSTAPTHARVGAWVPKRFKICTRSAREWLRQNIRHPPNLSLVFNRDFEALNTIWRLIVLLDATWAQGVP